MNHQQILTFCTKPDCDFCQKLPLAPKAVFVYHSANKTKKSELLKAPDEVGLGELRWGSGWRRSNTRRSHLRDMREMQRKMFEKWLQEWRNGDCRKKARSQDVRYEKFREVSPDCANGCRSRGLLLFVCFLFPVFAFVTFVSFFCWAGSVQLPAIRRLLSAAERRFFVYDTPLLLCSPQKSMKKPRKSGKSRNLRGFFRKD